MKDLSVKKWFNVVVLSEDAKIFKRALRLANITFTVSACDADVLLSVKLDGHELLRFLDFASEMGYSFSKRSFVREYLNE